MRVLFLGDVVGEPGRSAVMRNLMGWKTQYNADFVVVNGENAAGGRGISRRIYQELINAGADIVTLGDHAWDQKETVDWIGQERGIVRPLNFPPGIPGAMLGAPGTGAIVVEKGGMKLGWMVVLGRTFMRPDMDNPFLAAEKQIQEWRDSGVNFVCVEVHGEATSEKQSMGWWLAGKAGLVVGTHTHVQTADERILQGGTGYITDAGMCGPDDGVLGREPGPSIRRFLNGMPTKFPIAGWPVRCCGVVADFADSTGRCLKITRFSELVEKSSS